MRLLIDATNIVAGGGLSHLQELLSVTSMKLLEENEIQHIYVVSRTNTLGKLPNESWLIKVDMQSFGNSSIGRYVWRRLFINKLMKKYDIDFVFNPGGAFKSKSLSYVTMCRNMLVFEREENIRFGRFSLSRLKFELLRKSQIKSMKQAKGVIFISQYAKTYVSNIMKDKLPTCTIINHGISRRFEGQVKLQKKIGEYTTEHKYKILYVSILDVYKHHDKVAEAVLNIANKTQYPIEFIVVGGVGGGYRDFERIRMLNPEIIKYYGKIPFEKIQNIYKEADLFVFASTCENMPNILIEAMTTGLPIVSSNKEPMPEFLGEGSGYFDANDTSSIEQSLFHVINNPDLRKELATISREKSAQYDWVKCAEQTFKFISHCYKNKNI